jgi:hypothetical protein
LVDHADILGKRRFLIVIGLSSGEGFFGRICDKDHTIRPGSLFFKEGRRDDVVRTIRVSG